MKPLSAVVVLLGSLLVLPGCGESGEKAAGVVQAAGKAAGEGLQELGRKVAELSQTAPEDVRAKAQEIFDAAARELREARDSETVQGIAEQLDVVLERLGEMRQTLAAKLDVQKLQETVGDLIERFKNEPHVASALKSLQEKLDSIAR